MPSTEERPSPSATIPGAPRDSGHDLLTGISQSLVDQLQLPGADIDIARLLDTYDDGFPKRVGRELAAYANHLIQIVTSTLGDRPGRRVTRDAIADGIRNLPDEAAFRRPARVHALVQAVNEAAASVCTQRRLFDAAFDQQIATARADQVDDHPRLRRHAAYVQRALILPLAPIAFGFVLFVARRMDGWPNAAPDGATGSAAEYWEVAPFALSVVLLGVATALVTASTDGAASLRRMLLVEKPTTMVAVGAALSAGAGALTGVAGTFGNDVPWNDILLGALVWAAIGVAGYAVAFLPVLLVVNREASDALTAIFSRYVRHQAKQREDQSVAAKEATARIHDAALHIVSSRADVLVAHYYGVNILARRNSRSGELIAFLHSDTVAANSEIGNGGSAPCVCSHHPPPPDPPPRAP